MTGTKTNSPFWTLRRIQEQAFRKLGLVAGKKLSNPPGQLWHEQGGPTFALQWCGEDLDYVDQGQVSHILNSLADWRARNPNRVH